MTLLCLVMSVAALLLAIAAYWRVSRKIEFRSPLAEAQARTQSEIDRDVQFLADLQGIDTAVAKLK